MVGCRLAKGKQDRRRVTVTEKTDTDADAYVIKVIRFKQGRGYGS